MTAARKLTAEELAGHLLRLQNECSSSWIAQLVEGHIAAQAAEIEALRAALQWALGDEDRHDRDCKTEWTDGAWTTCTCRRVDAERALEAK